MQAIETVKAALVEEIDAVKDTARQYTVIFPFGANNGTQVLLGLKKRGMGVGLWNGFGGKVEPEETFDECARRELKVSMFAISGCALSLLRHIADVWARVFCFEECGLSAATMRHVGVIFMKRKDGSGMIIYVYTAHGLSGLIVESDEMKPAWFDMPDLPYDRAYKEARLWWPTMLSGKSFVARFAFSHPEIIRYNIECV
ncbi:Nudix (Nucleoside diphosphate linked moiety X)-type motif 1 [Coemansia sp. RSA 1843]|nr:Nudix (Nucleoside diphosphate linked moiety X)-type motif 1 [Coemansia sp. RSA 1843]